MRNVKSYLCILICCCSCSILTQCASYDYSKRKVQQGNLLPKRKIEALHVGMPKREVAVLMGTSLMSPMFNLDRWDYAYTWRKGSTQDKIKTISIYFQNDAVVNIETRHS